MDRPPGDTLHTNHHAPQHAAAERSRTGSGWKQRVRARDAAARAERVHVALCHSTSVNNTHDRDRSVHVRSQRTHTRTRTHHVSLRVALRARRQVTVRRALRRHTVARLAVNKHCHTTSISAALLASATSHGPNLARHTVPAEEISCAGQSNDVPTRHIV
jgi:hypothetical protein